MAHMMLTLRCSPEWERPASLLAGRPARERGDAVTVEEGRLADAAHDWFKIEKPHFVT